MSRLRVGSVPYLVGRPLDADLAECAGLELVRDVPARLVEGLRAGALDVALVSSIELFRAPGYRWLDGPVVAGRGFVSSVQLFLERPLEQLRRIVLDPASRSSQALVRVTLAAERPGSEPEYVEIPLGADPRAQGGDAWLAIGDAALRTYLEDGAPRVFNPAESWSRRTGLPFVFAAWIVRPGVEIAPELLRAFARAPRFDRERLEGWAREASRAWQLPLDACRRYLEHECVYDVGAELGPSLAAFRDRAAALGLAEAHLDPQPIPLPAP